MKSRCKRLKEKGRQGPRRTRGKSKRGRILNRKCVRTIESTTCAEECSWNCRTTEGAAVAEKNRAEKHRDGRKCYA